MSELPYCPNLCEKSQLTAELEKLREELDKERVQTATLRQSVYLPGTWKCDKCGFEQNNRVINPSTGDIGVRLIEEVEICPNDGETMRRVTWKETSEENYNAAIRFLDERDAARMDYEGRKASEEASVATANTLLAAIQEHRDQKADDRCWLDDRKLYAAAGLEQADTGISDPDAMLENCARFIACRMTKGKWPTYQELEANLENLKDVNTVLKVAIGEFLVHHAPVMSGTTEDQLREALAKA